MNVLAQLASLLVSPVLGAPPSLPTPESLPGCDAAVDRCAAIRLWIAPGADASFDDAAFLAAELVQANAQHGPAHLGFEVVEVRALGPESAHIATRADRDTLGHERWQRGLIDVYVVSELDDVDDPGRQIRGVHWRSRKDRERRWVILSRISPPRVLAHELGHYFGLPHSHVPGSLMNTGPNALPDRTFQSDELRSIERHARAYFADHIVHDPRGPRGPQ